MFSRIFGGIDNIFGKHYWRPHQQQIEKVATTTSLWVINHISQYILIHAINSLHGHIILVYDVWLFNIHSRFFTMTIMLDLLNLLFTSKRGNRIQDFVIFPRCCSDVRGHITNHTWWSTLLFVHFYHISQWSIFYSVCSHRSCCSNSHCAEVPQ